MRERTRGDALPSTKLGEVYICDYYGKVRYIVPYHTASNRLALWDEACYDELHAGPPYKTGGPFLCEKFTWGNNTLQGPFTIANKTSLAYRKEYHGYFQFNGPLDTPFSSVYPIYAEYGAEAWNKFAPSKPTADLGVFLAELRELPRMLKTTSDAFRKSWLAKGGQSSRKATRKAADNWLNYQFGWLPFINDLQKLYDTTKNIDKQLRFLRKNNGKWLHRGGDVLNRESSEVVLEDDQYTGHNPQLDTTFYNSYTKTGSKRVTKHITEHVWFEAAMKFYIPDINSPVGKLKALSNIYGLRHAPSIVWNVIPWSWLVDWCSNAGDIIDNLSLAAQNNLVAKYAYLMGTRRETQEFHSTAEYKLGTHSISGEVIGSHKERSEASPFGFGLSSDDFTGRQFSILTALGLTRML